MANNIQAIRGMHDVLPEQTPLWQYAEQTLRGVLSAYGYSEIRLPIVEKTELFKRSIGEVTDIVEKEMYTFDDRNGDSLTLRPEGTAGCLRACLEHGLLHNQVHRLWYYGPMYRHERPQKGRYRQFIQLGVETYGMSGPDIDAELILIMDRLWKKLGIRDKVRLQLNSLGTIAERLVYRETLVGYFQSHLEELDEDSLRRLETNPLRILDTKNPAMQQVVANAPELMAHSSGEMSLEAVDEQVEVQRRRADGDRLHAVADRAAVHVAADPADRRADEQGGEADREVAGQPHVGEEADDDAASTGSAIQSASHICAAGPHRDEGDRDAGQGAEHRRARGELADERPDERADQDDDADDERPGETGLPGLDRVLRRRGRSAA